MKAYEDAVETLTEMLKDELKDELLALILGGSVARGVPLKNSDIDVYGIVRGSWGQRRSLHVEGCKVELILRPAHQILRDFANTDMPATTFIFAGGRALYDPSHVLPPLIEKARELIKQGPPELDRREQVKIRIRLVDLLEDAEDLLEIDCISAQLVLQEVLREAIHAYYRIHKRWFVKPKYQLQDISENNPELNKLVLNVLSPEYTIQEKCHHLATLVDYVILPLGGRLGEWKSPVEQLPSESHP